MAKRIDRFVCVCPQRDYSHLWSVDIVKQTNTNIIWELDRCSLKVVDKMGKDIKDIKRFAHMKRKVERCMNYCFHLYLSLF